MNNRNGSNSEIQSLIRGCVKGKRNAQKQLYERFGSKMFGICLRYAKNYQNAEDLLQEGFIKVFKNIGSFRNEGSFEGWMRRIFVHTAIEHYRKQNPLHAVNEIGPYQDKIIHNGALEDLAEKDILKMVNRLSPGYRTVFSLYAVEGFSHKEISAMLNISEGTSKSQLARARYILQEMIMRHQASEYEAIG